MKALISLLLLAACGSSPSFRSGPSVVCSQPESAPSTHPAKPTEPAPVAAKSLRIRALLRGDEGSVRRISVYDARKSDDHYAYELQAESPLFVAIVVLKGDSVDVLYATAAPLPQGQWNRLPLEENQWLRLNDQTGTESVFLVAAHDQVRNDLWAERLKELAAAGSKTSPASAAASQTSGAKDAPLLTTPGPSSRAAKKKSSQVHGKTSSEETIGQLDIPYLHAKGVDLVSEPAGSVPVFVGRLSNDGVSIFRFSFKHE